MTDSHASGPKPIGPQPLSLGTKRFPALALASSGVLLLAVAVGSQPGELGTKFPLLALLGLCELGVIINLAGAYLALRAAREREFRLSALWPFAASLFAAGVFLWLGFRLWPL
ncbi:hypothetical protein Thiowin_01739 [Thiorhodovibrio winogradskyi]|uniref:Uncharacterized protein n=1 Tax=Thiorhodovibrio winogradskyi TaxID=77007 RepID=A0ABZ0SB30_9GAMM|nr:hypothetical protein [Thiorhodovibrio winogradskyi]